MVRDAAQRSCHVLQMRCGIEKASSHSSYSTVQYRIVWRTGTRSVAAFARIQRSHGLTSVFNVAYLLSSLGMPLILVVALVQAGSAQELADHIQRSHEVPQVVVAVGIVGGIASVLGAIIAAYVLARPLLLYRYESVALDEEMADKR